VFLADDHPIMRSGLRGLIDAQPDMEVVGEAFDGAAAVRGVLDLRPDVVVMDVSMPGVGGAEATERIRDGSPTVKVRA
jgi:DNA-binding NarL/FixJ family response regulator